MWATTTKSYALRFGWMLRGEKNKPQEKHIPKVACGARKVREFCIVAQIKFFQRGAGGDLIRQAAQVVRGQG